MDPACSRYFRVPSSSWNLHQPAANHVRKEVFGRLSVRWCVDAFFHLLYLQSSFSFSGATVITRRHSRTSPIFYWFAVVRAAGPDEDMLSLPLASALVICKYTVSSRSARAFTDTCLFRLGREQGSCDGISLDEFARANTPVQNHSRRYLLSSLWIRYQVFSIFPSKHSFHTCQFLF